MAFNSEEEMVPLPPGIEAMVKKCIEPSIKIDYPRRANEWWNRFWATREQEQRLIIEAVDKANKEGYEHFVDACCENLVEAMNGENVNEKPPSIFDDIFGKLAEMMMQGRP